MSSTNQLPSLPNDIIIDILIRLPAKPLMRFKSVCWAWYRLINGPDFGRLHLDTSLTTRSNLHLVFGKPVLHMADFDTFDNPIELPYPFKRYDIGGAFMGGYCNGLFCLSDGDYHDYTFAFYNPTTRTHRILPYLPTPSNCLHLRPICAVGFGYDALRNDYKFVRISQFTDDTSNFSYSELMVYSLINDTWTKVLDHVPYDLSALRSLGGPFFNGSLHWIIVDLPNTIVGFNISTNTFFELPVPQVQLHLSYVDMYVGELDGCLCLVLNYVYHYEIWIMKEYGVGESWTRLYEINRGREFISMEEPLGFSLDRKALYARIGPYKVVTIDMESMEIQNVDIFGDPSRSLGAYICVENLLMLDYSSEVPVMEQLEVEDTSKRRRKKNSKKRKRN